jgi:hypothetical protein
MDSYSKNNKNGVSVIIVFLIMAICLSVVLGTSAILIGQAKIMNSMGDSVRAIYLGDSGIEKTLYYDKNSSIVSLAGTGATRGICYSMANCTSLGLCLNYNPPSGSGCSFLDCNDCTISFNGGLPRGKSFSIKIGISSANAASTSTDSFLQSTGNYNGTSRLIELDILK